MRDGIEDLEAALGQFGLHQFCEARTEQAILMHQDHGLGGLAGGIVEGHEIVERALGDDAEAGREAEGVGQAAGDDLVRDADIDDIAEIIARRRLGGGKADRTGEAADDRHDAVCRHALDFRGAAFGCRARVAEHHFQFGATQ
jgi:hypothetical protein